MSENRWLATGNFFTSYRAEQRIFLTNVDRLIFVCFLVLLFVWPLLFEVSNKYMLVIDSILIAIVAVYGLNLLTGFAGLISIGHAAFHCLSTSHACGPALTTADDSSLAAFAFSLAIIADFRFVIMEYAPCNARSAPSVKNPLFTLRSFGSSLAIFIGV